MGTDAKIAAPGRRIAHKDTGEAVTIEASGRWVLADVDALDRGLAREIAAAAWRPNWIIDGSGIERLDTAGAWLLHRTRRQLESRGAAVRTVGLDAAKSQLLATLKDVCFETDLLPAKRRSMLLQQVARLGAATEAFGREALSLIGFFGALVTVFATTLVRPWRLRGTAFSSHVVRTGVEALPIVGLLSFLIGMVLAFQGASQLTKFGAEIFTIDLLGVSILREIGVLMTAIIVAGRSGSAFTAQIGTMVVNQEVDALRTLGLDPLELLVLPRLLALMVSLPLLAFFANIAGIIGGCLMAILVLHLPLPLVLEQLQNAVTPTLLWVGLVKAPVFAFVIAMVGCRNGLRVSGGADSVGRLTTDAVVTSIFLVIVIDAIFAIGFTLAGI